MGVLVFNPGSTTLKVALWFEDGKLRDEHTFETWDLGEAARTYLRHLDPTVTAIGCRVVHGGNRFSEPILVTPDSIRQIDALGELAPLHNYGAAAVLRACFELAPQLPVVAVFDTAFHQTLPEVARTYAIPYQLAETESIQRYGFHGLSHQTACQILATELEKQGRKNSRLITCHLGGGASICAIKDGKSIDTSMGFSPLEGIMMATRSGDLDPGVILYLLRKGWTLEQLERTLNHESGLQGISGLSIDPRVLFQAADEGNPRAALALHVFTYRIAKTIASYMVPLQGVDGISFSGGIGENSARIRETICQQLQYLGIEIDQESNQANHQGAPFAFNTSTSAAGLWVIPNNEAEHIAKLTQQTLAL